MKKILLLLICCLLTIGCSSVSRSNTLKAVSIEPEIEPLPVAADLRVSEQKVTAEVNGIVADVEKLTREALTKALGQEPPSVDKPDVLVGMNIFTEVTDKVNLKLTITGYPAYYTNFHTAREEDWEWLNIVKMDRRLPMQQAQPQEKAPEKQAKPLNFGVRLSGGLVGVSGDEWEDHDWGYGLGAGVFKLLDLNFALLNVGAQVAYKSIASLDDTYNGRDIEQEATEIALEVPILLRYPIGSLYVETGIQVNLAFAAEIESSTSYNGYEESDSGDYDGRNFIDLGIAIGVGYNITNNFSVDARYFFGLLTDVDEDLKGTLHQITFGVNYLF